MKIEKSVKQETLFILYVTVILSMLLQAVFLIVYRKDWNYTMLLGNVLGAFAGVLNFFLLGLTVQKAIEKEQKHEKDGQVLMRTSKTLRFIMIIAVAAFGCTLPCFNPFTTVIPLLFPRAAIAVRPFLKKKSGDNVEK